MAAALWNSPLAPPRSLSSVASPPPLPFTSLSLAAPSSTCFPAAARRSKAAMGSSPSVIARASDPSAAGFDESAVDAFGNVRVLATSTGMPVFLKDLWDQEQGMAVVALLRHFGCICCWELASELKEFIPRLEASGVKLIAVGVGSPDNARILAERTKVFSRFDSLRKAAQNYTISATPDDKSSVLQQGGMLVFKGKDLLYARKDEGTGDHAPLTEVLDICCKVPVA